VSANEWTAVVGLAVAIVGALYGTTRFMVKSIMAELQPNGGNSLKDQVSRIEARLDQLMLELTKNP
jgi:C4-dicarboxylate-specific signal transduction histidine kinase